MSSYDDTFYSISIPSSGFDFSTTNAFAIFEIESNISVSTTVVSDAYIYSFVISSEILVTTNVVSDVTIYSYVVSSDILPNSSVTSNALIVNSISSGISILPNVSITSAALIVNVSSNISITPNVTVAISTVGYLVNIQSAISSSSKTLISSIDILRTGLIEDSGDIKPFFVLDGIPLTEHNRRTSITSQPNYIANKNWTNKTSVYFKTDSNKKSFSMEWSYAPGKRENTVDLHASRDYVKEIASNPISHILKIREMDTNGLTVHTETSYNVLVTNFNENLVRRDLNNNEYYWNFSLALQEV